MSASNICVCNEIFILDRRRGRTSGLGPRPPTRTLQVSGGHEGALVVKLIMSHVSLLLLLLRHDRHLFLCARLVLGLLADFVFFAYNVLAPSQSQHVLFAIM